MRPQNPSALRRAWALAMVSLFALTVIVRGPCRAQTTEFGPGRELRKTRAAPRSPNELLADLSSARQSIEKNPSTARNYLELGRALKELGETDAALRAFDHACELNPKLPEALFEKGSIVADKEKWNDAADFFRRAIWASPNYVAAHIGLAEMLIRTGDFENSRKELNTVLRLDPESASAYQGLGLIDLEEAKFDPAEEDFRHALALWPEYVDAQRGLARSLTAAHKWREAADLLRRVLQQDPESTEDVVSLARALDMLGDKPGAQAEFSKARELSRNQTRRLRAKGENNSGIALRAEGKLSEAAAAFRRAVTEDAHFCEAHDNLGGVLWLENDPAGALREFQLAAHCDPNLASARNNLGNALLYFQHDLDGAIREFRAALNLRPAFALAHFNLAKSLAAKQDLAGAKPEFREAIAVDPQMAAAHVELGLVLAIEGGRLSPEAQAEIEKGLELDPKLRAGIPAEYRAQLH